MSYVVTPRPQHPQRSPFPIQVLIALVGGGLLFLLGVGIITGSFQFIYAGRILPKISVAGVDLSNKTPEQAVAQLNARITYPLTGQVVFRYKDEVWVAHPQELGLVFDVGASVQKAYEVGRGSLFPSFLGQISVIRGGMELPPVIVFD